MPKVVAILQRCLGCGVQRDCEKEPEWQTVRVEYQDHKRPMGFCDECHHMLVKRRSVMAQNDPIYTRVSELDRALGKKSWLHAQLAVHAPVSTKFMTIEEANRLHAHTLFATNLVVDRNAWELIADLIKNGILDSNCPVCGDAMGGNESNPRFSGNITFARVKDDNFEGDDRDQLRIVCGCCASWIPIVRMGDGVAIASPNDLTEYDLVMKLSEGNIVSDA